MSGKVYRPVKISMRLTSVGNEQRWKSVKHADSAASASRFGVEAPPPRMALEEAEVVVAERV